VIVIGFIGLLWSLPVPETFARTSPVLNWGAIFLLAAVVYYFIISISLAFGMLPFILFVVITVEWMERLSAPLWATSASLFILAWAGQSLGHWLESERPCFFRDLQFLMIGPLWLLAAIYRRLRIPY